MYTSPAPAAGDLFGAVFLHPIERPAKRPRQTLRSAGILVNPGAGGIQNRRGVSRRSENFLDSGLAAGIGQDPQVRMLLLDLGNGGVEHNRGIHLAARHCGECCGSRSDPGDAHRIRRQAVFRQHVVEEHVRRRARRGDSNGGAFQIFDAPEAASRRHGQYEARRAQNAYEGL